MRLQVLCLALAFCAISASAKKGLVDPVKVLSASSNAFSHDLFAKLSDSYKGKNLIYSPLSVYSAVAMLAPGVEGKSIPPFSEALRVNNEMTYYNMRSFVNDFNNVKNVSLQIANKIYTNKNFTVKPKFVKLTRDAFLSEAEQIDVNKPSDAANTINKWVSEKTHKKIQNFTKSSSISKETALLVISAIYFKGQWANKFEKYSYGAQFYSNKTTAIDVPFMSVTSDFSHGYLKTLNAQFVRIPYSNKDLEMIIIMPKNKTGLSELEKKLETFDFNGPELSVEKSKLELVMPKFKFESTIDLKGPLSQIGLADLFKSPDLSGISDRKLKVSEATQKAFIEVNEEGSEAAAATGLEIESRMSISDSDSLIIDKPFHFIIKKSLTVLFQGHVHDPRK